MGQRFLDYTRSIFWMIIFYNVYVGTYCRYTHTHTQNSKIIKCQYYIVYCTKYITRKEYFYNGSICFNNYSYIYWRRKWNRYKNYMLYRNSIFFFFYMHNRYLHNKIINNNQFIILHDFIVYLKLYSTVYIIIDEVYQMVFKTVKWILVLL